QTEARAMTETVAHPTVGDLKLIGMPYKFSGTPASVRRPPPILGEHTEEILREELGLAAAPIAAFRLAKVICPWGTVTRIERSEIWKRSRPLRFRPRGFAGAHPGYTCFDRGRLSFNTFDLARIVARSIERDAVPAAAKNTTRPE